MKSKLPGLTGSAFADAHPVSHPELYKYVQEVNHWASIWAKGKPAKHFDLRHLTVADRRELNQHVECALSPENLACDGEAPASYVRTRGAFLRAVQRQLSEV